MQESELKELPKMVIVHCGGFNCLIIANTKQTKGLISTSVFKLKQEVCCLFQDSYFQV